ncbi:MAG TPA: ABC transporter substrate-binding protein, partial [Actinomycetota bacterium]|nr:ABC transporter substrate-binding protein [Actinomycetota bacterium]
PPALRSCAGPYSISKGASEGSYTLTRTTRSRSENEAFSSRRGRPKTIRFRAAATPDDAFGLFTKGEVDIAPVPISAFPEVTSRPGFHRAATSEVTYLAFGANAPPTNDRFLRRAVSLAIDRLVVIDAAFGDGREPALRWLKTNTGGEIPPACVSFIRRISDPARAKSTLSQSVADPSQLKLTLHFDKTDVQRLVVEALQVEMKDILGIQVEVDGQETPGFQQTLQPGAEGVWLLRSDLGISSGHGALGSLLSAGSPLQRLGYADPALDASLLAADSATGPEQRKAWGTVEEGVCDEMQVTPLWFGVRNWMFAPGIFRKSDGSELGSMGEPRLRDLPV